MEKKMSSSYDQFDSVKAEKADAIRRYNRKRSYLFCFHRLITALALLCSFPYFPLLKEIFSDYLSLFNRQLFVFCLINAMIFVIYNFSNTAANGGGGASQPDIYDQYVSLSSKPVVSPAAAAMEIQLVDDQDHDKFCDKEIVLCENVIPQSEENSVSDLTEITKSIPQLDSVCNLTEIEKSNSEVVKEEEEEIIHLRRSQSEKYEATVMVKKKNKTRSVLRRSETENGREVVLAGGGGCGDSVEAAKKSMEDMNSDEFRFTIERFIASKKKVLRDENFAVVMEERDEETFSTAAITCN